MTPATYAVVDGKAVHAGRTLAEWVPVAVADLVRACDPFKVILHGSVARGDDGPDSDIDLLVVLPHVDPASRHEVITHLRRAITAPVPVDVIATDPGELRRRADVIGSFLYVPVHEGRVVYERAA